MKHIILCLIALTPLFYSLEAMEQAQSVTRRAKNAVLPQPLPTAARFLEALNTRNIDYISENANQSNVNQKDDFGRTALHHAASSDWSDALNILIERGADVNARDVDGITPLHMASGINCISELIKKGGNVNAQDRVGRTPLHIWAGNRVEPAEIIFTLVKNGANPNSRDYQDATPLHYAVEADNTKGIDALIACGASVELSCSIDWEVYEEKRKLQICSHEQLHQ